MEVINSSVHRKLEATRGYIIAAAWQRVPGLVRLTVLVGKTAKASATIV